MVGGGVVRLGSFSSGDSPFWGHNCGQNCDESGVQQVTDKFLKPIEFLLNVQNIMKIDENIEI